MYNETSPVAFNRPQLRLPVQAAPVERRIVGSALSGDCGVEASAWWNDVIKSIPDIVSGVSSIASLF